MLDVKTVHEVPGKLLVVGDQGQQRVGTKPAQPLEGLVRLDNVSSSLHPVGEQVVSTSVVGTNRVALLAGVEDGHAASVNEHGDDVAAVERLAQEHILQVADWTEGLRLRWLHPVLHQDWPQCPERLDGLLGDRSVPSVVCEEGGQ